ncbi:competence protein ComK [Bacillus songklensis]|uniref:Competence protein ComK n=1 Tax=Bacillus songklensis TaxID=1069116 RepID=A0ABV8B444_9BACI
MIINEEYEIGLKTMAVMYHIDASFQTRMIDLDGDYLTSKSPQKLFDEICLKHGSTYEGRREAVVRSLGYEKRTPFLPALGIYTFPSASPQHFDCVWLFPRHILQIVPHPTNHHHSIVKFHNGSELVVKARPAFLKAQYERTAASALRFQFMDLIHLNKELLFDKAKGTEECFLFRLHGNQSLAKDHKIWSL